MDGRQQDKQIVGVKLTWAIAFFAIGFAAGAYAVVGNAWVKQKLAAAAAHEAELKFYAKQFETVEREFSRVRVRRIVNEVES